MAETSTVVVGRADILGRIELNHEAPESLDIPAGGRLQVKLLFKYVELSTAKDDYDLRLESEFAGTRADPIVHTHKDHRGIADDEQGFIMQEYTVPTEPGYHLLTYMVYARFTDNGQQEDASIHGQVMVTVS